MGNTAPLAAGLIGTLIIAGGWVASWTGALEFQQAATERIEETGTLLEEVPTYETPAGSKDYGQTLTYLMEIDQGGGGQ